MPAKRRTAAPETPGALQVVKGACSPLTAAQRRLVEIFVELLRSLPPYEETGDRDGGLYVATWAPVFSVLAFATRYLKLDVAQRNWLAENASSMDSAEYNLLRENARRAAVERVYADLQKEIGAPTRPTPLEAAAEVTWGKP